MTAAHLSQYQISLYRLETEDEKTGRQKQRLCAGAPANKLAAMKRFFLWLWQEGLIVHNPSASIQMPKHAKMLPRNILTPGEAKRMNSSPSIQTSSLHPMTRRLHIGQTTTSAHLASTPTRTEPSPQGTSDDYDFDVSGNTIDDPDGRTSFELLGLLRLRARVFIRKIYLLTTLRRDACLSLAARSAVGLEAV